jgi:hypothetical protein
MPRKRSTIFATVRASLYTGNDHRTSGGHIVSGVGCGPIQDGPVGSRGPVHPAVITTMCGIRAYDNRSHRLAATADRRVPLVG